MVQKIHEIEPSQVKEWLDNGDALLFDVREVEEFNIEYIPHAKNIPGSTFNAREIPLSNGKKIIFHCRGGRRSLHCAEKWADLINAPDGYSMKGGIEAWKSAGFSIRSNQAASRDIQKQAYLWAGGLILAGTALAAFTSAWFLLLPALAGGLLLYAGLAGTSMLSLLLSKVLSKKAPQEAENNFK